MAGARRALRERRIGHTGTLDPFASGLLVLLVGRATRLAPFAGTWTKRYTGTFSLGRQTDTDDATGAVLAESEVWRTLEANVVAEAMHHFVGGYDQRPPDYSAKKVDGARAHRLARAGREVTLTPRPVEIEAFTLTAFDPPEVSFAVSVGSGTYIRALARDVGARLGCGAHLTVLRRTAAGPFSVDTAIVPDAVAPDAVRNPRDLLVDLPTVPLDDAGLAAVRHGRAIPDDRAFRGSVSLTHDDALIAVAEADAGYLRPRVVLLGGPG